MAKPKLKMSQHAAKRLRERFPGANWEHELDHAHPWGVRVGKGQMLLSPAGIVFVVEKGVIKTVMPRDMAIGDYENLAPGVYEKTPRRMLAVDILDEQRRVRERQERERREANVKRGLDLADEKAATARSIAERHATEDHMRGLEYSARSPQRLADAVAAGLGDKYRRLTETLYVKTRIKLNTRVAIEPHPMGEPEEGT